MAPKSGLDIYGYYLNEPPPRHFLVESQIDKTPVNLPHVLSHDELPPFSYPPIDPHSQVRLISLLPPRITAPPGESMEPIECTIEVCWLSEKPQYEALSYTWGGMKRYMPISIITSRSDACDTEAAIFATPQLLMALRRLRLASRPRKLWIDQLCIDQDNLTEVGPQVQLMGDIYRKASRVVIWLGEDVVRRNFHPNGATTEADSGHMQDLIQRLAVEPAATAETTRRVTSLVQFGLTYHFETVALRRLRALYEFLSRPWFSRAWVFQEASLARELVVQFGKVEMKFDDVEKVYEATHWAEIDLGVHHDIAGNLATSSAGYEMIRFIQQARRETLQSEPQAGSTPAAFLCKLLQVLRRVHCHNPVDLIFAFLAFQHGEDIVSTAGAYERPAQEVWRHAAERIMRNSKSLDIFAALPGSCREPDQLSWVPCWANCFPCGPPIATPVSKFNACRGMPFEYKRSVSPKELRVRGKIIDRIHHVNRFTTMGSSDMSLFLYWDVNLQTARSVLYQNEFHNGLGDHLPLKVQDMPRDLMRTLLADGALGHQQPLPRVYKYVEAVNRGKDVGQLRKRRHTLTDDEESLVADYERLEDLALVAKGKRWFFTEHLQLGLAAEVVRHGDLLAILHGSKTPVVLREMGEGSRTYTAVCQCYLNNWMYGQPPSELCVVNSTTSLHPHVKWWEEEPDEIILV